MKPLSRDTLTQQATDAIRRFILNAELKSGDQLPSERDLSQGFSVSRNIVREALSVLVAEGLIEKKAGRGIFVCEYDPSMISQQVAVTVEYLDRDLAQFGEARSVVELGSVELMTERVTQEQLVQLQAVNDRLAANLRAQRSTIQDDIEFHKILLHATHNSVLIELIPLLVEHIRLTVIHEPQAILNNSERIITEHQRIIDALRSRDSDKLRHALRGHPLLLKS